MPPGAFRLQLDPAHTGKHLIRSVSIEFLDKRPRSIEWVNEPLRDDAGKVRRSQLRDERIKATAKR